MNCREKTQNRISLVLKLLTLTLQLGQLGKLTLTLTQAADLEVNFLSTYLLLVRDDSSSTSCQKYETFEKWKT